MKTRACTSVRTWIAGLAGVLSLAGMASAGDNTPPRPNIEPPPPFMEAPLDPGAVITQGPGGSTNRHTLRAPPPVTGGGCQPSAPFVSSTGAITQGYTVTLVSPGTGSSRVDNFKVAGSGSQPLTSVSWSGYFRTGAAGTFASPTYAVPGTAVLPSSFIITIFDNVNGEPVQLATRTVTFAATVTPTIPPTLPAAGFFNANAASSSTDTVPTGNGGTSTFPVIDYTAVLDTPVALTGGNCYWIEIRPTPVATASPASLTWIWRSSNQGDGLYILRTPNGTNPAIAPVGPTPSTFGVIPGDMSFCMNVPTVSMASGLACPVGSQMSCWGAPNFTGQVWDGTGAIRTTITGIFTCADNFTTTCPMTINNVCFYGTYFQTTTGFTIPTTDSFRIRIYQDAGGTNVGVPGTLVAERIVTTAGTSDGSVFRGTQSTAPLYSFLGGQISGELHRPFNANLTNPIILPSGGCYWLEIAEDTVDGNYFSWWVKGNARTGTLADGFCQQIGTAGAAYSQATQVFNADFVWGFNLLAPATLVRSTSCIAIAPIPNTSCTTATTLTIGATAASFSHNIIPVPTTTTLPPGCFVEAPTRNGSWFRVVGNGQNVTLSTCETGVDPRASQTNFDTVIGVYCSRAASQATCNTVVASNANTNPFICIASNDDAPTSANCAIEGASSLTFPTVSGQSYYIFVWGATAQSTGYFYIRATTTPGAVTAPACGTVDNCRITVPTGMGAQAENEACGASTNNTCTVAENLPLGVWGTGALFGNSAGTRDADYWHLPAATSSTTDGGEWFTIEFRAEFPPDFTWFNSPCVDGVNATGVISTGISQCTDGSTFNIFIPAGEFYLRIRSASSNTPPCDPLSRGNRYAVRVSPAAVGACCVTGSFCALTVSHNGQGLASDPQDCSQRSGVYLGDGTTCSGPDNLPCDASGGVVAGTTTGSCCDAYGICYVSSDAALTCANGVFTAMGTCTAPANAGDPFTCTPTVPAQRCCSPNGVCIVVPPAQCLATAGNTTASGAVCLPNSCTPVAPQGTIGACCDAVGACFLALPADCPVGGAITFIPSTSSCSPTNPCPAALPCCLASGNCTLLVPAACTGTGVTPGSGGTTCPPTTPCPQPTSVCCQLSGVCVVIPIASSATCDGTVITTTGTCPPTPACDQPTSVCCLPDGTCAVIPIGNTTVCSTGTVVTGTGTCPPTPACTQPTTCCAPDGTCTVIPVGGTCSGTAGPGSVCNATTCPIPTVCCRAAVCTVELPSACTSSGGGVVGNGNVCNAAPDSCKVACCTSGGCVTVTLADCATANGIASTAGLGSECTGSTDCSFQACCTCNSESCQLLPVANCTAINGTPQGPSSVCNGPTNPCQLPTTCCLPNGQCTVIAVGGTCSGTVGGGSTCPPAVPCPQPSVCCKADGSCEVVLVGGTCTGTLGVGSTCPPSVPCPQPTTCCLPNGTCSVINVGGFCAGTVGGGSTCPPATPCPQPTACCKADGSCVLVDVGGTCDGVVQVGQTACPPSPACPPPAQQFCCRGTTCNPVTTGTCTGVVAGSNSIVRDSCGSGNAFISCCFADYNHDGLQSIDDLFLYFNAYFTSNPMADFGGTGTSQPTIDDLFLYINAYFGTCT